MGMREPSPPSTCTPPPRHNGGRPARPLRRPRSPGRVAGCFGRTQTRDALGRGGGRGTHQLADPVQVVQKVLHRLALHGRNTHSSGRGHGGRRRGDGQASPGVGSELSSELEKADSLALTPRSNSACLARWPCSVPVTGGAAPSDQATGPFWTWLRLSGDSTRVSIWATSPGGVLLPTR